MTKSITLATAKGERIAVVAGLRTPFAKQATAFHGVPAVDLCKMVVNELLQKHNVDLYNYLIKKDTNTKVKGF